MKREDPVDVFDSFIANCGLYPELEAICISRMWLRFGYY